MTKASRSATSSDDDTEPKSRRTRNGAVRKTTKKAAKEDRAGNKGTGTALKSPTWNTSKYRGVTKHRRSGRWEAHIWIGGLNKQIYLGGYSVEEHAAEAYDMAALKTKGFTTATNFDKSRYKELEHCLEGASLEEVVTAVRRQSQGFSRGTSTFRGVSPHPSGRFEARIGISGNKHVYLGLFDEEPDAARAYDRAVVRIKGSQASTNFTLSDYCLELCQHEARQKETPKGSLKLAACVDPAYQRWVREGTPLEPVAAAAANQEDLEEVGERDEN